MKCLNANEPRILIAEFSQSFLIEIVSYENITDTRIKCPYFVYNSKFLVTLVVITYTQDRLCPDKVVFNL